MLFSSVSAKDAVTALGERIYDLNSRREANAEELFSLERQYWEFILDTNPPENTTVFMEEVTSLLREIRDKKAEREEILDLLADGYAAISGFAKAMWQFDFGDESLEICRIVAGSGALLAIDGLAEEFSRFLYYQLVLMEGGVQMDLDTAAQFICEEASRRETGDWVVIIPECWESMTEIPTQWPIVRNASFIEQNEAPAVMVLHLCPTHSMQVFGDLFSSLLNPDPRRQHH